MTNHLNCPFVCGNIVSRMFPVCACTQCFLRKKDVFDIFGDVLKQFSPAANVFAGNLRAKVTFLFLNLAERTFLLAHYC